MKKLILSFIIILGALPVSSAALTSSTEGVARQVLALKTALESFKDYMDRNLAELKDENLVQTSRIEDIEDLINGSGAVSGTIVLFDDSLPADGSSIAVSSLGYNFMPRDKIIFSGTINRSGALACSHYAGGIIGSLSNTDGDVLQESYPTTGASNSLNRDIAHIEVLGNLNGILWGNLYHRGNTGHSVHGVNLNTLGVGLRGRGCSGLNLMKISVMPN